jgi:hypothetical protein
MVREQLGIAGDFKDMQKSLAVLSNEDLKETMEDLEKKLEAVKKEMRHRGVR